MGWLVAVARNTNLDYGHRHKEKFVQKRELGFERLGPGQSFIWSFESANPSDRFSVITFLDEVVNARHPGLRRRAVRVRRRGLWRLQRAGHFTSMRGEKLRSRDPCRRSGPACRN